MRWLIRKVVKWVLEAILESEELDVLMKRFSSSITVQSQSPVRDGGASLHRGGSIDDVNGPDDIDSSRAIADAIIGGTKRIEMSGIKEEDVVVSKGKPGGRNVLDMLKNIDDVKSGE